VPGKQFGLLFGTGALFIGDSLTRTNPHRDGFAKAGIPERLSENIVPHGSAELCFFAERL